jgi:hypothetical protein
VARRIGLDHLVQAVAGGQGVERVPRI